MRVTAQDALRRLSDQAVIVASALIAGFRRGETAVSVAAQLRARPPRERALVVGATLAGLLLTAMLAAQGGLLGMAAFFTAVILLVR